MLYLLLQYGPSEYAPSAQSSQLSGLRHLPPLARIMSPLRNLTGYSPYGMVQASDPDHPSHIAVNRPTDILIIYMVIKIFKK